MRPLRESQLWAVSIGAGMLAGAAGTYMMGKAMPQLKKLQPEEDKQREKSLSGEGSVMRTAKMVAGLFNLDLSREELGKLATFIHWSYGIGWGGVFGGMHRLAPGLVQWAGLPFGFVFFAVADETIPTAFGVAPKPTQLPVSMHLRDLAGHLVYTVAADAVFHALTETPAAVRAAWDEGRLAA